MTDAVYIPLRNLSVFGTDEIIAGILFADIGDGAKVAGVEILAAEPCGDDPQAVKTLAVDLATALCECLCILREENHTGSVEEFSRQYAAAGLALARAAAMPLPWKSGVKSDVTRPVEN